MRNILALLGLVIVLFAAIGYVRGWYSFDIMTDSSGRVKVSGDIDTNKIKDDGNNFKDKAGNAIDSLRNKNPASAATPPAALPGTSK